MRGGGARAASVSPPSSGPAPPPPTPPPPKKKKKKAGHTAPKAAPSQRWRLRAGGKRVGAPPGEGGGEAGAASEPPGLGRGGAARGGAGRGLHLPRSFAAPTEVARVRPGDFPAPPDGGGGSRWVNGAAGVPLQPPAARRHSSGTHSAPSAGASSADGGAGAPQRQQLPRRQLGLPAVAVGGSGGGRSARSLAGARLEAGAAASRPRGGRGGAPGRARGHRRTRGPSGRRAPAMTSRLFAPLPGAPAPGGGGGSAQNPARSYSPGPTTATSPDEPRADPKTRAGVFSPSPPPAPLGKR